MGAAATTLDLNWGITGSLDAIGSLGASAVTESRRPENLGSSD